MSDMRERIQSAADTIRAKLGEAETAIVLGSGLGDHVQAMTDAACLPYAEIPGMPVSTAPGHAGKWWRGTIGGKRVFMLQGRFHLYEGISQEELVIPVRVMKLLGVRTLILTNAAGCANPEWKAGTLMMLTDYINFSGRNPLIGPNMDEFGPRFPDMSEAYSQRLRGIARETADRLGIGLREGVYMLFNGPTSESPAEVRMARLLGADAVGMSTVPETIAAHHCGIEVLGISCLTNMAAGLQKQPLSHEEVQETAARVSGSFRRLLNGIVEAV